MSHTKNKSGSPRFRVGDKVRVKYGVIDPDFSDIPLGGWSGTVTGDRAGRRRDHLRYQVGQENAEWDAPDLPQALRAGRRGGVMPGQFRVGVTRDFLGPDGCIAFGDIGLSLLDQDPNVSWEFLAEHTSELRPDQVRDHDALLVLAPRVTAATLENVERLAVVARFGVGYDTIDVSACTRHGVLLTITPDGVRRPVATAAMTFLLALSHKLLIKDRLTRQGRWAEKLNHMGMGLTGRTLGIIGLGNIGQELCGLARPFGMRLVAFDPHVDPEVAGRVAVERCPWRTCCASRTTSVYAVP